MAKYPRSNRKKFQIQKGKGQEYFGSYIVTDCNWEVWGMVSPTLWGRIAISPTKKKAREYVAQKRRAVKNRRW